MSLRFNSTFQISEVGLMQLLTCIKTDSGIQEQTCLRFMTFKLLLLFLPQEHDVRTHVCVWVCVREMFHSSLLEDLLTFQ